MKKLLSFCDDPWSLGKFGEGGIGRFLDEWNFDGVELMKWGSPEKPALPTNRTIGRHLLFWPMWLDFWREDHAELLRQFGSDDAWQSYYGAATPEEFVKNRRQELLDADRSGAEYAVYHVSHVRLEHCHQGQYTYHDAEIVEAFADMLNQIVDGLPISLAILLENHWYPGMTFLESGLCEKLIHTIQYDNLGFVLDTGHLMNTWPGIRTEEDATVYILSILDKLSPQVRHAIRTMHLNCNISADAGDVSSVHHSSGNFQEQLIDAMHYVSRLDPHKPFASSAIQSIICSVNPEYLVYELAYDSEEELRRAVLTQSRAAGNIE